MCITFVYINSKCEEDKFRFVLIFNRDEFYNRATSFAHFWQESPSVLGGRDEESTLRGTWLAVSATGKIGTLLNISDTPPNHKLESRGVLVSDYIKNEISPMEYVRQLTSSEKIYNGYNLLLFDIMSNYAVLHTNMQDGTFQETTELPDGVHGISNSRYCEPYKKVEYGKKIFDNILRSYNSVSQMETLISKLVSLLERDEQNYPDEILYRTKKETMAAEKIKDLSSIFVRIPEVNYGTRTHTIILADSNNMLYFNEFNLEPRDLENPSWIRRQFRIRLQG